MGDLFQYTINNQCLANITRHWMYPCRLCSFGWQPVGSRGLACVRSPHLTRVVHSLCGTQLSVIISRPKQPKASYLDNNDSVRWYAWDTMKACNSSAVEQKSREFTRNVPLIALQCWRVLRWSRTDRWHYPNWSGLSPNKIARSVSWPSDLSWAIIYH
jgi:hypothetical protein